MSILRSDLVLRFLILSGLILLCSCGKYGSPLPPEDFRPAGVRDLRVEGDSQGLEFSWLPPATKIAGGPLDDLDGFTLGRAVVIDGERSKFRTIAKIGHNQKQGPDGLQRRVAYKDSDVKPGLIYDYILHAFNKNGRKGLGSKVARIKFRGRSSDIEVLN